MTNNASNWDKWEIEEADSLKKIAKFQEEGHSPHCACRQVWGDGECECDMYAKGYDPYAWMRYNNGHNNTRQTA